MTRTLGRAGLALATVTVLGLVVAGLGFGASSETSKLNATLNAAQEVPKQEVAVPNATGSFTGTLVESGDKYTIKWKLTFKKLSGAAGAAHIHLGKKGKAGDVLVPLCGPCKSGAHGTAKVTKAVARAIKSGRTYVNIHTAKNPAGEIRGQTGYDD
jgi:hypothetical protein